MAAPSSSLAHASVAALAASVLWVGHSHVRAQPAPAVDASVTWAFDSVDRIGGQPTIVLGDPRVVQTSIGTAVEFDGVDDALFVRGHPLAGATAFTWEAIFRPDGGARAQRWFHLQEEGTPNRMLFEIRVVERRWFLDSYAFSATGERALMNRTALHPLGEWYHVASVYDGTTFSNYVDGVKQTEATIALAPQRDGWTAIGVRINLVDWFKGAIHVSRFTRRALAPAQFLPIPRK
jgi:hypothetical protein